MNKSEAVPLKQARHKLVFNRLSRFDRLVLAAIFLLLLLIATLIWRGDQVGLAVSRVTPPDGSESVSTLAKPAITFAQNVANKEALVFQFTPPVSGTVRWAGRTAIFSPADAFLPDTTYAVTVPAVLQTETGRTLLEAEHWQFTTRHARLLYLNWDEENRNQLFLLDPAGGEPEQLTQSAHGVLDYAVAPDGSGVAFSALREDGGADQMYLALSDRREERTLLECELAVCSGPVWTPDGNRLVYERRTLTDPNAPPGPPRLYWLDPSSGETLPVFADSQWLGLFAQFAPTGEWLSYVSPQSSEVHAYNLVNGQTVIIPSSTGEPGAWSPDGDIYLVTDITFQGEQFSVHIYQVDLATGELTNLSNALAINDGSPVFSPDGKWILFGRKVARAPMGKQLWKMRPDGSELTALTTNPDIHNGYPSWSPDGRYLTMQRYAIAEPGAEPGIAILDVATGELSELLDRGTQPKWLP